MARNKRPHKTGIGYGHVFHSPNARPDFSEIKYKLNTASLKSKAVEFDSETLSVADRIEIKNKIRQSNESKTLRTILITVIVLVLVIIAFIEILEGALFRH